MHTVHGRVSTGTQDKTMTTKPKPFLIDPNSYYLSTSCSTTRYSPLLLLFPIRRGNGIFRLLNVTAVQVTEIVSARKLAVG